MFRNWILGRQALANPAFAPFVNLFHNAKGNAAALWELQWENIVNTETMLPPWPPEDAPPMESVYNVVASAPDSVRKQLLYILTRWGPLLGTGQNDCWAPWTSWKKKPVPGSLGPELRMDRA